MSGPAGLPPALCREHRTAPGVWGMITAIEGRLMFRAMDPPADAVLTPGRPAAVAPQQPHEVEADGPVRFHVKFYRADGSGPERGWPRAARFAPVQRRVADNRRGIIPPLDSLNAS